SRSAVARVPDRCRTRRKNGALDTRQMRGRQQTLRPDDVYGVNRVTIPRCKGVQCCGVHDVAAPVERPRELAGPAHIPNDEFEAGNARLRRHGELPENVRPVALRVAHQSAHGVTGRQQLA
ncbi:MAG TPA: hypothetical protein VFU90_11915, partial [Candidatus Tumulicola sp.]|nr:hypothetical protein [Candidatus Tumulicola sp.]